MQHLSEKWLRIFNYYYILYCVGTVGVYVYFVFEQGTLSVKNVDSFGASFTTATFAAACVLYNLFLLRSVRRYNLWLAYVISFVLCGIANSAAIEVSLGSAGGWFFAINAYIIGTTSVVLGPIVAIAVMGIICIVYAMTVAGTTTPTGLGVMGDGIALFFRILVSSVLLFVLRNKFEDPDQSKKNYIERYFVTNEIVGLLTDSISDGIIIIDQNEIVRSINPAALELLDQESKNVTDLNYRSVLKLKNANETDVDPDNEPVLHALKTGKSTSKELLLFVPGKQEIFIDVTVSVIANPQTHETYGAVIILRDVSKKKKEEAARSEFISTASHEMRTPVAAIEGFIELALNDRVSTIDARARKYLEKARSSTQHLGRLFQDLLVSAKAEDGRLSNHPAVIDLGEVLEQQAEMSKMAAQQKGLQLEFVISSGEHATKHENLKVIKPIYYVFADPDRIREVASNLIDNALKYTPHGKVTVGVTGNNEVVQFFIRDTGVGISQEDIPHLFQKFYRVDSSDTRTTGGTGLGLFICKEIADLYHGRVWAESVKGQGTTFYVNLPRMSSSQAEMAKAKTESQQVQQTVNKPTP